MMTCLTGPGMFRIVLALLVFLSHVSRFEVGRPAVMVFFILSGYWVLRLFDRDNSKVLRFETDRFLRVWPLFAIVAVIAAAIQQFLTLPYQGTLISTLPLIGLASRSGDLIGVSWSLDIEMEFYLLLPLVVLAMRRLENVLDRGFLGVLLLAITIIGAILLSQGFVTVAAYAPAFAAGGMICRTGWRPGWRWAVASLWAFVAVGIVFALVPALQSLLLKAESEWWRDLVHLAWCLLLVPFIAFNVHQPSDSLDRHLGNLSYPLYLVHPLVVMVAITLMGSATGSVKVLALAGSLALALLLYVAIDRPIERFRHRMASYA